MVFNTIDYIITQKISYIKNSRSYSGIKLSTDHRLVKVILQIPEPHQLWKKPKQQNTKLTYQQTNIKNFSNMISTNFTNIEDFQKIIYKSALKCFKKQSNQQTKIKDPEINKLKNKINKSRNILKNYKINQTTKINLYKEKHIQKKIYKKCLDNKSSITEEQLKEIENSNYNQRMHKAIKQLNIKHKTPPPPYTNFQLTSYYKEKFNKSTTATQQKQENQTDQCQNNQ